MNGDIICAPKTRVQGRTPLEDPPGEERPTSGFTGRRPHRSHNRSDYGSPVPCEPWLEVVGKVPKHGTSISIWRSGHFS